MVQTNWHSDNACPARSFSEITKPEVIGQSIPMLASFQSTQRSNSGAYKPLVLYNTSAVSDIVKKPCANPSGIHNCFLFFAESVWLTH